MEKKTFDATSKATARLSDTGGNEGIMILRIQNIYEDGLRLKGVVYVGEEIEKLQLNTRV